MMLKVQLKHTSVLGNRERSVALMKTIKFNILDPNRVCVDEEMKLRKLMATETPSFKQHSNSVSKETRTTKLF